MRLTIFVLSSAGALLAALTSPLWNPGPVARLPAPPHPAGRGSCAPEADWLTVAQGRALADRRPRHTFVVFSCAEWDIGAGIHRAKLDHALPWIRSRHDVYVVFVDISRPGTPPDDRLLPLRNTAGFADVRVCTWGHYGQLCVDTVQHSLLPLLQSVHRPQFW